MGKIPKYLSITLFAVTFLFFFVSAINFILLIPAFTPVVGSNVDWLQFWGGLLGGLVSSIAAFIILYVQRKDNEQLNFENRSFQVALYLNQLELATIQNYEKAAIAYRKAIGFFLSSGRFSSMSEESIRANQSALSDAYNVLVGAIDQNELSKFYIMHNQLCTLSNDLLYMKENPCGCLLDDLQNYSIRVYEVGSLKRAINEYICTRKAFKKTYGKELVESQSMTQDSIASIRIKYEYQTFNDIGMFINGAIEKKKLLVQDKFENIK